MGVVVIVVVVVVVDVAEQREECGRLENKALARAKEESGPRPRRGLGPMRNINARVPWIG